MPSVDDIYNSIGALITSSTGRLWWRKGGIQSQPPGSYATVFIEGGPSVEIGVVETIELSEADVPNPSFQEVPWGEAHLRCKIEFLRGGKQGAGSAYNDATKFSNSLRLSARDDDIWKLCGLVGKIETRDISAIFASDVEGRADVTFDVNANLAILPNTDTSIYEITSVDVSVSTNDETTPIFDETITKS